MAMTFRFVWGAMVHKGRNRCTIPACIDKISNQKNASAAQLDRRLLMISGASLLSGLAGCSGPGADLPPLAETGPVPYHLGPGDRIRLITLDGPELTGEFLVNDAGNLALPLIGTVPAADRMPKDVEQAIANQLKRSELLREPNVSLEVVQYRPIFVLGEVSKPGQYPYQTGMTTVTAVAIAGGFTYRAVEDRFSVVRTTGDQTTEGRAGRQAFLQPGDVLTVYERHF
jgi:polysaccharide export outer membrane protein